MNTITYDDFAKLDLRVVTITAAEPIEGADRLLKLTVCDGTPNPRIVVAGIRGHVGSALAEIVGIQVVIVANLEPRTIKGVESHGMILVASAGKTLQLIMPQNPTLAGSKVG